MQIECPHKELDTQSDARTNKLLLYYSEEGDLVLGAGSWERYRIAVNLME